jgi:hypothetical protein
VHDRRQYLRDPPLDVVLVARVGLLIYCGLVTRYWLSRSHQRSKQSSR